MLNGDWGTEKKSGWFHHLGRLWPFRAVGDFKLHFLAGTKRLKSITHNPCVVDEHIVSVGLLDKSVALLRIKPLHKPLCQNNQPPLPKRSFPAAFEYH